MNSDLQVRLVTEIVLYHLEQNPTRNGRGYFLGIGNEAYYLVDRMCSDIEEARLLSVNNFKERTGKGIQWIVRLVVHNCLNVFAQCRRGSTAYFIHKSRVDDLQQRIRMDLLSIGAFGNNSPYDTRFLEEMKQAAELDL